MHRQSVSRWHQAWKAQGAKALKKAGRKPRLQPTQLEHLSRGLKEGPEALGYGTGLWTTWRVADFIERPDADPSIFLQLEMPLGLGGHYGLELLLSAFPRQYQGTTGH